MGNNVVIGLRMHCLFLANMQLGEFESQGEAMKAHRRQTAEKKYAKAKKSLAKDREHRLADLKV